MSTCSDAAQYFSDPVTACAVCMAESSGNPNALGDGGTSYSLFQVHAPAHPDYDLSRAFDPAYNAQYAAQLQRSSGWGPWSTYNSGAYKQYLGQCGGSASNPGIFPPDIPAPAGGMLGSNGGKALLVGAVILGAVLLAESV